MPDFTSTNLYMLLKEEEWEVLLVISSRDDGR